MQENADELWKNCGWDTVIVEDLVRPRTSAKMAAAQKLIHRHNVFIEVRDYLFVFY
jgi:hypothetical protein